MTENYLDMAPCGFFSFTNEGSLMQTNDTFCRLLGYGKEELVNVSVESLFTVATRIFFQTHLFPLVKMQGFVSEIFITLLARNKKEVPVLLNARRINEQEQPEYLCVCIPVHNRQKYEEEILQAKHKAEQALLENTELLIAKKELQEHAEKLDLRLRQIERKNEELKQFNRVVTHDLQEPLRKLNVFMSFLQKSVSTLPPDAQTITRKIAQVSHQMNTVVSGLQQYVWLTDAAGEKKEVSINNLLLVVQQQLNHEFGSGLLHLDADAFPLVKGYWEQLYILFYHLLANAIRYRKPGEPAQVQIRGTVVLENTFRSMPHRYKYEDFLQLQVKDQGVGFDNRYRIEIFDLFRRLHVDSGMGLGLALCKKVVENHDGLITADSQIGEGSWFTILLPLQEGTPATVSSGASSL